MNLLQEKYKIGIDYPTYHKTVEQLLAEGKTSGTNHSEDYIHYTEMNMQRMNRILKTVDISPELSALIKSIDKPLLFLVIGEAWCGDVAQNIPIIHKMVDLNPNWQMRLVWRDENLDLMNQYLTNGGISIPKVIVLDANTFDELAVWGPRPVPAQDMMMDYKKDPKGLPYMEFAKQVQLWYAKDKGKTLQGDWLRLLDGVK